MANSEKPFKIAVSDEQLDLLRRKLELTRLPDELKAAGWDLGVPLADIQRLLAHWKGGYNWRAAEAKLNEDLPMFTRDIEVDGHGKLNIHYVHKKSEVKNAIPLLFVHGWPGNFIEVRNILPLLVKPSSPGEPAFHVVGLGLPGFGFSEQPHKREFGSAQYAETGHKLMLALGYEEYVVQGGDWGFWITQAISGLYGKEHVKAWHTNMPVTRPPSFLAHPLLYLQYLLTPFTAAERAGFRDEQEFKETGWGYFLEQSTKPQTLAYSLADSPMGLLAWIYEKLVTVSDNYPWTDDEVLTWISIYWFSRAGPGASIRIYHEIGLWPSDQANLTVKIPIGVSYFPGDVFRPSNVWTHTLGPVVQQVQHEHGGHFAAYAVPELLVADLRKMYKKGGPAYGVVPGKPGYDM